MILMNLYSINDEANVLAPCHKALQFICVSRQRLAVGTVGFRVWHGH